MLYLLYGTDGYRIQERLGAIRASYREANPGALGETIIDPEEESLDRLRAALAQGGGLFEAKGLLIARGLYGEHKGALVEALAEYDAARREDVNVVIVEGALGTGKEAKTLTQIAKTERIDALESTALPEWIARYVHEHGPAQGPKKIEKHAAEMLARTGSDLWRISRELEKLLAYTAGAAAIQPEHIRQLVRIVAEETVFPISDGICERTPETALAAVMRLTAEGEDPDGLVGYAIKEARQLARAHAALHSELPGDPLELFGAKPFVWNKRSNQARKWSDEEIAALLDRTVALEATWKGSGDTRLALDAFILAAAK